MTVSTAVPNGAAAPDSACRCASCGIKTDSQPYCAQCAAYIQLGAAITRLHRVLEEVRS